MIHSDKLGNALYALNGVLIQARFMAHERNDYEAIADVLDRAEELPRLMATIEDQTETFGMALAELASRYPDFQFVVDRFQQDLPAKW